MILRDLAGLIPEDVGLALSELAAGVPARHAVVEIGSYKGKSTCYLASGAKRGLGAHVWAIDPWDLGSNVNGRFGFAERSTREAFDRQVESMGHAKAITPIQGFSVEVAAQWEGPAVGLLYVDGDHCEDAVYGDYRSWQPYLAAGATVVFDDLDTPRNPGVRRAIERLGLDFEIVATRLAVCHV